MSGRCCWRNIWAEFAGVGWAGSCRKKLGSILSFGKGKLGEILLLFLLSGLGITWRWSSRAPSFGGQENVLQVRLAS